MNAGGVDGLIESEVRLTEFQCGTTDRLRRKAAGSREAIAWGMCYGTRGCDSLKARTVSEGPEVHPHINRLANQRDFPASTKHLSRDPGMRSERRGGGGDSNGQCTLKAKYAMVGRR